MPASSPHNQDRRYPGHALRVATEWLVLRAQDGDAGAFEQLARLWHKQLLAHATRLTGRADAGEEATQEAWLGIVRGLHRLHDPARFGAWAYGITTRQAALWIRKKSRRAQPAPLGNDPAVEPDVSTAPQTDVERLRVAIAALPRIDRATVALRYELGLSVTEVAEALQIPVGTAKRRLFELRQSLRAAMLSSCPPVERNHP